MDWSGPDVSDRRNTDDRGEVDVPGSQPALPIQDMTPLLAKYGVDPSVTFMAVLPPSTQFNFGNAPDTNRDAPVRPVDGAGHMAATSNAAFVIDPLPNEAPVANPYVDADQATVDEDSSVVIDVLANDTDPDGDALVIAKWDWDTPNGTVSQTEDGKLKYEPHPDFHGSDSFTYTVSDGRDEDIGTVEITVTSVNDTVRAFDDFDELGLIRQQTTPESWMGQFGTFLNRIGGILDNDVDYDTNTKAGLEVCALRTDYADGVATGNGAFGVAFSPYLGVTVTEDGRGMMALTEIAFSGLLDFEYKVTDGEWVSDWATVTILVFLPEYWNARLPYNPGITAEPDSVHIGDDAMTANVATNDTGHVMTMLISHPSQGRVTGFSRTGELAYSPSFRDEDGSLAYLSIWYDSAVWWAVAVPVQQIAVKMTIYDGQNGAEVKNEKEKKVGAITVANKNDTDSDYIKDDVDEVVSKTAIPGQNTPHDGEDEKDLMQLRVYRPVADDQYQNDMTVESKGATTVSFYKTPDADKNNKYAAGAVTLRKADFANTDATGAYATLWVEAVTPSANVGDIEIKATYKDQSDTAKATAIWASVTQFRGTGSKDSVLDGVPNPRKDMTTYLTSMYISTKRPAFPVQGQPNRSGELGVDVEPYVFNPQDFVPPLPGAPANFAPLVLHLPNALEIEFAIGPVAILGQRGDIGLDVSRSVETIGKYKVNNQWANHPGALSLPDNRDKANDDLGNTDEISVPIGDKLYQMDAPGALLSWAQFTNYQESYFNLNGFEFVRVRFGAQTTFAHPGKGQPGAGIQGSRASELVDWHSWSRFQHDGASVKERPELANGNLDETKNHVDRGRRLPLE